MAAINMGDTGSATSTVHAATINSNSGTVTTESLTTADALTVYTFTLTDANIAANSVVVVSIAPGSGFTTGVPVLSTVTPAAGSCVIKVLNASLSAAFNGPLLISYSIVG